MYSLCSIILVVVLVQFAHHKYGYRELMLPKHRLQLYLSIGKETLCIMITEKLFSNGGYLDHLCDYLPICYGNTTRISDDR